MEKQKKLSTLLREKMGDEANLARMAELERLTGCPIALVIEGRCEEAGCQNEVYKSLSGGASLGIDISDEMCLRLKDMIQSDCKVLTDDFLDQAVFRNEIPEEAMQDTHLKEELTPIIDTRSRLRCVL